MAADRTIDQVLRAGTRVWRGLAPRSLRSVAQPFVASLVERRMRSMLTVPEPAPAPGPLIVSGLISETKGVSEGARLTIAGLRAAGYAPIAHDLRPTFDEGPGARGKLPTDRPGGVWLIHVNAPEAIFALAYTDPRQWRGRKRIGYWAYELQRIPDLWVRAAPAFHEIWAPSRFVADALTASGVTTPVRVMPHPVAQGLKPTCPDRPRFGIPADAFTVLAMGDLASSPTRKNLTGAIDIYRRVFPEADGKSRLIVKVQGDEDDPEFRRQAEMVAGGRSDITILSARLSDDDVRKLVASCDVLLSPHRAEGFGLPLAEAFMLGAPALATGWSGNLEFMADMPELLIRSTMAPVRDAFGVYRERDQSWAEPDVADAVTKLHALAADAGLRRRLAARGKAVVEKLSEAWSRAALEGSAMGGLVDEVAPA